MLNQKLQAMLMADTLFGVLPERDIVTLSKDFCIQEYDAGQLIFEENDLVQSLFVILKGEISIEKISIDGKIAKISQLSEGNIFGEFAILDGNPRSASAIASKPTTLACLPKTVFIRLVESHTPFSKKLMSLLISKLRKSTNKIERLVTMNLSKRTAKELLNLSQVQGHNISITQSELAKRLGASRERVNITLKEFERSNFLKVGHGKISILNESEFTKKFYYE